jgi:outer membrane protein
LHKHNKMKKLYSIIALVGLFLIFGGNVNAQKSYKFGHIDSQQLLSMMPEREQAKSQLEKYSKSLEDQVTAMQSELERKYQQYVAQQDSLSPLIKQAKEKELSEIQQRFQQFQQTAQQDLQQKESELMQPIIEKAKKAIDDVATENNFTYVFDIGTGVILHYSEESIDILPLVLTKLGISKPVTPTK